MNYNNECEYKKVAGIIFDETKKYVLAELINGVYCPITPKNYVKKKYSPVIGLIKGYFDIFGKKMTCWTHVVKYNDFDYYTILTDVGEFDYDEEKYAVFRIDDLTYFNCSPEFIWLVHMSLDPSIKNTEIVKI